MRFPISASLAVGALFFQAASDCSVGAAAAFPTAFTTTSRNTAFSRSFKTSSSSLWSSTVRPPPPRIQWLNDEDKEDKNGIKKRTVSQAPSTTTAESASAVKSIPKVGALSMNIEQLAQIMGGKTGRAQLAWDCYAIGIDPALYYGSVISLGMDDYETILGKLPTSRRHQRLGADALQKLAQTYATASDDDSNSDASPLQIEGGVASLARVSQSADGTTKMLLQMRDGLQVETVIIPFDKKVKQGQQQRSTVCLSSQVGCRQACTFCATGRMGIQRSLTSDEILAQYFFATKLARHYSLPRINNVVFMGMGDAADNAQAVTRAVRILTNRQLFQLSAQKVTVSTVAPTPEAFMDLTRGETDDDTTTPCVLAWSVHAANNEIRQRLVPTMKARGYTVEELRHGLVKALLQKPVQLRTTMLQVTLLKNINDSLEQADEMATLAESIVNAVPGCKLVVNLIPWNDINDGVQDNKQEQPAAVLPQDSHDFASPPTLHYQRPSHETVTAFQQRLWQRGIYAHVRTTRGDDATAACGQLATKAAAKKTTTTKKAVTQPKRKVLRLVNNNMQTNNTTLQAA